jgi:hypothetical protein
MNMENAQMNPLLAAITNEASSNEPSAHEPTREPQTTTSGQIIDTDTTTTIEGDNTVDPSPKNTQTDHLRLVSDQTLTETDEQQSMDAADAPEDTRTVIQCVGGNLHTQVEAITQVLAQAEPPVVYQRGGSLCFVAHSESTAGEDGITPPTGTALILPANRARMNVELNRLIDFQCKSQSGWASINPPKGAVESFMASYGCWSGIPVIKGISETPLLMPDGTVHSQPGFDPETQMYVEGKLSVPDLPEKITKAQAQAAAAALLAPFEEFPFVEPELDKAVLLAYLFTLALRPTLKTAPLFGFSATSPGTGKGLIVEAANTIVRGRDAALLPPTSGRDGENEMRKRITSCLMQGLTSICLDNYSRPIGGDSLNVLLTATEWSDRALGSNNVVSIPVCCTIAATGNNLTAKGDQVRRSLICLLDANCEHPEQRAFKEKDLIARVTRDRETLLRNLYIVLKGYAQSDEKKNFTERLGRFEDWSDRVSHPIQWLGYPSPTESQKRLHETDPEGETLATLLACWHEVHGDAWIEASKLIDQQVTCFEDMDSVDAHNNLEQAALSATGDHHTINTRTLGWYLRRNTGRIAEGFRLERKDRGSSNSKHAQKYRVVKS